jgi:MFS family permease
VKEDHIMTETERSTGIFYGWWLVLVTFGILVLGGGYGFYSFTVLIIRLEEQFGWTRTQVVGSASAWAVCFGLSSPLVGYCLDRFGARRTMAVSVAVAGLAYLLLSRMSALWMLYAGSFIAGGAMAGFTLVPAQTLMSHWFSRFRGRAIGLTMLGTGCGGMLFPPLTNAIVEAAGWSSGYLLGTGVLWIAVLPLVVIFIRSKPSELGLLPDGAAAPPGGSDSAGQATVGVPVKVAVTLGAFWLFAVMVVLHTFGGSATKLHFHAFAEHSGFDPQVAANFLGLTIGFSMVGRVGGGFLADRFNPRYLLVGTGCLFASAIAVLAVCIVELGIRSTVPLYAFAPLYGLGLGSSVVITPVFVGRCFGLLHFGKILGFINMGFALGVVFGPILLGRLFDVTDSYRIGLWLCFAVFAASAMMPLLINPERTRRFFVTEGGPAET